MIKGTVLDITTRYQLLQQLKKSEQLYKQAEALSHIGNWSWELKNNTFLLSDEVYRIFEIPGLPVKFDRDDFINNLIPSERPHIEHIIRDAISHRRSLEFTLKYKVSAGVIKTVKVLGEVTYDEHIHSIIIIGTCQDISVQQEIEHKLRMNKAELEQSNMSLREYAYVASHDLQEPLRKISTFADRLRTSHEAELSEQAKSHLSKIISSSIRMQQMIRDLLSVSIINSERSFESVNMDKLFQEVLQHFEDIIEHKKITITADRLPEATVIPSQIRQLFQNLISNSIKFSHPQIPCHIKLTTSLIEDPGDDIKNLIPGRNYLKIMISDNGIGFNNQFAEKIFTIFQRLHRKQEFDGTGIGLAICRRIAENHNGMIKAFGEEGKGAVFTIIIPA